MKHFVPRLALVAVAAFVAASPLAALAADSPAVAGSNDNLVATVIWSAVGVAGFLLALSIFYALKRGIGAFPKNPSWVAPISIRPSRDFLQDVPDDHGHGDADEAGHGDAHGAAPAH